MLLIPCVALLALYFDKPSFAVERKDSENIVATIEHGDSLPDSTGIDAKKSPSDILSDKIVPYRLSPIQVDMVGYGESFLPEDLWSGSDRKKVEQLIESVSSSPSSQVMHDLFVSLLVARSDSLPEGTGKYDYLIELRVKKLSELGKFDDVEKLIGLIPQSLKTDNIKQIEAYNLIQKGQYDSAYLIVKDNLSKKITVWNGLLLLCQLGKGEGQLAGLTFSLLRDDNFFANDDIYKHIESYIELIAASENKEQQNALFIKVAEAVYKNSDVSIVKYHDNELEQHQDKQAFVEMLQKKIESASQDIDFDKSVLLEKIENYNALKPTESAKYHEKLFFIMESLGITIQKSEWDRLWYANNVSEDLIARHMKIAADESRVGETVLLVSQLLAKKKVTEVNNHRLLLIIQSLKQVGLDDVARKLAIEALNVT